MSPLSKTLPFLSVVLFLLACGISGRSSPDTGNLQKTARAPGVGEAENVFDPQGTPLREWKGIPVMPEATAGQEFNARAVYSFRAEVGMEQVREFYDQKLAALGWQQPYDIPVEEDAGLMIFQKDKSLLTIAVTSSEDSSVVILTME